MERKLLPVSDALLDALHAWDTSIAWAHEEAALGQPGDGFDWRLHRAYEAWLRDVEEYVSQRQGKAEDE